MSINIKKTITCFAAIIIGQALAIGAHANSPDDEVAYVEVKELSSQDFASFVSQDLTGYNDDCIVDRKKGDDKKKDDWDQWDDKKKKNNDGWDDGWGDDPSWPSMIVMQDHGIVNVGDDDWDLPGGDPSTGTPKPRGPLGRIIDGIDLTSVINIGEKVWKIIQDGQPAVEFKKRRGHALPKGVNCWVDLNGWRAPVIKSFSLQGKNARSRNLFEFSYRIVYMFGGSYQGKGRFLTGITVIPEPLKVGWGRGLDVRVQIPTVVNVSDDKENPIAGAMLEIGWKYQSHFKAQMGTQLFFIRGDGPSQLL